MADIPQLILDIGTHKVLGLAVRGSEDHVEVLASALRTHGRRAMRDGQVHDVPAVARTVRAVVDELEHALAARSVFTGTFSEAHIAAAGRALHTARGRAEQVESRPVLITADMQRTLEWDAVADAQGRLLETLPRAEHAKGFYCIAHSRTESLIDGEPIASLVDQRGSRFSVEVLATFLPGIVVDSLQAVLRNANLEMRGLTLEPVAALEAVVPETMRHLRLMLVDVGAGTTDIALTGEGKVQAYAMVPLGGDSITEALASRFLLDFNDAERAKRQASGGGAAPVQNVLGDTVVIDKETLRTSVRDATAKLATSVGRIAESWELEQAPDAVLLVGGGSNTPDLPAMLAEELNMPSQRVAVRDRSAVRAVTGEAGLQGPDAVTALGIALRFAGEHDAPPVRVQVNGRPVSLFQPDRCTVREAARIAGLPLNHLVGRIGQGMTVTVNGELLLIPGRRGQRAAVRVNDEPASLDTLLQMNDDVELQIPSDGDAARVTVRQLIAHWSRQRKETTGRDAPSVIWNGVRRPLPLQVRRHNEPVLPDAIVLDRDEFDIHWPRTLGELLDAAETEAEVAGGEGAGAGGEGARAGGEADAASDAIAGAGDTIIGSGLHHSGGDSRDAAAEFTAASPGAADRDSKAAHKFTASRDNATTQDGARARDSGTRPFRVQRTERFAIVLNGTPTTVELPADFRVNGQPAGMGTRINDGDRIDAAPRSSVALYELLSHPEIDALRTPGTGSRQLRMLVQGEPAGFTTVVRPGDAVDIRYD